MLVVLLSSVWGWRTLMFQLSGLFYLAPNILCLLLQIGGPCCWSPQNKSRDLYWTPDVGKLPEMDLEPRASEPIPANRDH